MSVSEVLELAGALVIVVALGLAAAAVVPPAFVWSAGMAVVGVGLIVLSLLMERAANRGGGGA